MTHPIDFAKALFLPGWAHSVTILLVTHDVRVAAKAERVLFILDGKIAGEYLPGAYDETCDDFEAREAKLTAWLAEMKF